MEVYKRKVGYEDFGRTINLVVTSTTLNFPIMLTQNYEDIGIYTDTKNPVYEIVEFSSLWNLTANNGVGQKPCGVINNCTVNFTETPIAYFGASNGAISTTVTSCSPSTYEWTGPNGFGTTTPVTTPTITGLVSGNYTLKIVDTNCDISYASYYLQQPQGLSFNLTSTNSQVNDINGTCNGSASVVAQGGVPPYTYLWYSGTTSNVIASGINVTGITNLCSGTYNVQITDSTPTPLGPIIVSGLFNITEPNALSGSVITTTNINCTGGNNGSITVQGIGGVTSTGYTYTLGATILNTASNAVFNNLTAGNYTVQIKDDVGSIYNVNATVSAPTPITIGYSTTPGSCYGDAGSITVNPVGGTAPYSTTLTNTSTSPNQTYVLTGPTQYGLHAGNYSATVTDANGCTSTATTTLLQRPPLNLTHILSPLTNGYNIACYGGSTTVVFQSSYGSGSYTYPAPTNTITYYIDGTSIGFCSPPSTFCNKVVTLSAGTHTIKVVDSNGCSTQEILTITQPAAPLSVAYGLIKVEDSACGSVNAPAGGGTVTCSTCSGCGKCRQAVIDINGGVAPYTITWSDGGVANQLTSASHCLGFGNVTATVTDANGCIVTVTISI